MDAIDRRAALRALVCGAVTIGLATSLPPGMAEAAPLAVQKDPGKDAGDFKLEAQGPGTRPPGPSAGRPPGRPPTRPSRPPLTGIVVGVAVGSAGGTAAVAGAAGDGGDGHAARGCDET
ncbi:hypothetical protein [Bradyrhizobium sp. RDI18]|uniref:hypothetical protein n=1 Tax=Bradyrhizobium sp. RDI18 TaxID=3367400 RepID=UPI00371CDE4C